MKTMHLVSETTQSTFTSLCGETIKSKEQVYRAKGLARYDTKTVAEIYRRIPCKACLDSAEFQLLVLANV